MTGLRKLISLKGSKALVLLLAVLGMHALVPVGYMVAASPGHGLAVTMCPVTHPLARAALEAEAQQPALDHAAMGHGGMDHSAMGMDKGGVDHAAMGHGPGDDGTPASAQAKPDCAFSALGSAAIDPGKLSLDPLIRDGAAADIPPLPEFAVQDADRLRPPLRAPPRKG
jgi:hypothetical protein